MIISKKLAQEVLERATESGADFAELYCQNHLDHVIVLSHRRVESLNSKLIYGAGLRLFKGVKCVYGYTSDLSKKSLLKLAEEVSSSFKDQRVIHCPELKKLPNRYQNKPEIPHSQMTDEEKIAKLKEAEKAVYAVSPLIVNAWVKLLEMDEDVEIYNTKGNFAADTRVRTRFMVNSIAAKDGQFQSAYEGPGGSYGDEVFTLNDTVATSVKAAKLSVALLSAPVCPSGKMTVIIGNKFGGVLFHESCGHPLEGTAISHKTSVFWDKLGKPIASKVVSAIDDGTIVHGWGSSEYDDEGEKTTKNVLIKDGILVSYMMDDFDGRRMNRPSTGACRRQSYKFLPTTRMTNTYIDNGSSTPEEIIKATKEGLYCVSFAGGSVDPSTDKFNFTASEAYVIKDGKIDHLVRNASLVGYGYEVLPNIDMVGNDLARGQGNCGAASGSIPVDVGQPTIRVQNMTVGGGGDK